MSKNNTKVLHLHCFMYYNGEKNKAKGGGNMSSTIQVRVDEELRVKSDNLFKSLGTDTTSAIRMFLRQAVDSNGFPFVIRKRGADPYSVLTEDEIFQKLELSRLHADAGMTKEAGEVIKDMRVKYGL